MSSQYHIPKPVTRGVYLKYTIGEIIHRRKESENEQNTDFMNPMGLRTIMGFPIPDWQRPLVWTEEQKIKFIESIWYGYDIGTYSYNGPKFDSSEGSHLNFILIDGQQRLSAIQDYMDEKFPVFGPYWSELDKSDTFRFRKTIFGCYETKLSTEKELRDTYNRMNFSGTNHTEDQRA